MRSSAPSTERQRGFSLLEVIIAASLFSVVMLVALSQIKESGDAANLSTMQADLRRTGEKCLNDMVRDLRSSMASYAGPGAFSTSGSLSIANEIQFAKVTGFDATTSIVQLGTNFRATAGADAPIANTTYIYDYKQIGNELVLQFGQKSNYPLTRSTTNTISLSQELASLADPDWPYSGTTDGFQVTWGSSPAQSASLGLLTTAGKSAFSNAPLALTIKLVLKRQISGKVATGVKAVYAWTTVQTTVELRPDDSY